MKIIYLTSKKYPGVSKYGEQGEAVGLWKVKYIEDQLRDIEGTTNWGYLKDINILIVSPYGIVSESTIKYIKNTYPCKIGYLWHSSAGEVELAREVEINELSNLVKMFEDKTIDFLCFTTKSLAEAFNGIYLPHPVKILEQPKIKKEKIISFFCPPTSKKAIFPQLIAVKLFQKNHPDFILHTNLKSYIHVLDRLKINYQLHNWLEKDKFYEILEKSKFALQCSFSESFNYFVADCLMCNTPVITSKEIDWNPMKYFVEKIDPLEIMDKMNYIADYLPDDIYLTELTNWKKETEQKNKKIKEILDKL